jgi:hypothetical protein
MSQRVPEQCRRAIPDTCALISKQVETGWQQRCNHYSLDDERQVAEMNSMNSKRQANHILVVAEFLC